MFQMVAFAVYCRIDRFQEVRKMRFPPFTASYMVWAYQLFRGRDVEFIDAIEMLPWWEIRSIGRSSIHKFDFREKMIQRRNEIGQLNRHH